MKRILSLILLAFAIVSVSAQDAKALYKDRYSYDLKQDKISLTFDGRTFWLRAALQKDDTLTLVFNLKGETPQTATESIVLLLPPADETVEGFANKIANGVRGKTRLPADISVFAREANTDKRIITFLAEDRKANVLEDSMFKVVQTVGKRVLVAVHSRRLKLDEALANPDLASKAIGDHRTEWLLALNALKFPF